MLGEEGGGSGGGHGGELMYHVLIEPYAAADGSHAGGGMHPLLGGEGPHAAASLPSTPMQQHPLSLSLSRPGSASPAAINMHLHAFAEPSMFESPRPFGLGLGLHTPITSNHHHHGGGGGGGAGSASGGASGVSGFFASPASSPHAGTIGGGGCAHSNSAAGPMGMPMRSAASSPMLGLDSPRGSNCGHGGGGGGGGGSGFGSGHSSHGVPSWRDAMLAMQARMTPSPQLGKAAHACPGAGVGQQQRNNVISPPYLLGHSFAPAPLAGMLTGADVGLPQPGVPHAPSSHTQQQHPQHHPQHQPHQQQDASLSTPDDQPWSQDEQRSHVSKASSADRDLHMAAHFSDLVLHAQKQHATHPHGGGGGDSNDSSSVVSEGEGGSGSQMGFDARIRTPAIMQRPAAAQGLVLEILTARQRKEQQQHQQQRQLQQQQLHDHHQLASWPGEEMHLAEGEQLQSQPHSGSESDSQPRSWHPDLSHSQPSRQAMQHALDSALHAQLHDFAPIADSSPAAYTASSGRPPISSHVGGRRKSSKAGASGSSKAAHFESQQHSPALVPVGSDRKAAMLPSLALGSPAMRGGSLPVSRSNSPSPLSLIPLRRGGSGQLSASAAVGRTLPRLRRSSHGNNAGDTVGAGSETVAAASTRSSARVKAEPAESTATTTSSFMPPQANRASMEDGAAAAASSSSVFAARSGNAAPAETAASGSHAGTDGGSSSTAGVVDGNPSFRIECGSGTSHFVYDGLPILWRKASQKKEQHALVPTYVYLFPRVDSVTHIELVVDGQTIRVPRSRDVNPKNAHLANFVLCDDEQHALFQLVQNEQHKRKPDVIVNGVKLHRMHLMVQGQRIPFFYCSQKRITIEKAFASLNAAQTGRPGATGAPTGAGGRCTCAGRCLTTGLSQLQHQLHSFLSLLPEEDETATTGGSSSSSQVAVATLTRAQQYDRLLAMLQGARQMFVAHRSALLQPAATGAAAGKRSGSVGSSSGGPLSLGAAAGGGSRAPSKRAASRSRASGRRQSAQRRRTGGRANSEDRWAESDEEEAPQEDEDDEEEEEEQAEDADRQME